jgi:SagB-type dehydrogenase family enzyme
MPRIKGKNFEPFIYPIVEKVTLSRKFEKHNQQFIDVFLSRRSTNQLSSISILELSELLYYCGKVQYIEEDEYGGLISKRAAPSAGARHPIDLLISPSPENGFRFLSYYNPVEHSLNKLSIKHDALESFFVEINQNVQINDASLIWFCIQKGRTSSKYKNAQSLYWRDAGALIYCIQITCAYLGLNSCPLGSLAANFFKNLFDTKCLLPGGGILIGK